MSVDPRHGPAYQGPATQTNYPPDSVPPIQPSRDRGFTQQEIRNPDGADAGPLYVSPEADKWLQEHVTDQGLMIDWGTYEIFDPVTGEVKGTVPRFFPRMS
jgi:hypothetical protein